MQDCDFKVRINGQHTFLISQVILCRFSGRLRRMVKQKNKRNQDNMKFSGLVLRDYPGGPDGFELVSRFCYNNGSIPLRPSTVSSLYCSATYLEMTDDVCSAPNLLAQAEAFLDDMQTWALHEILEALKSCEQCISIADSSGLLNRLINSLLRKIKPHLNLGTPLPSSSSSPSSSTKERWFLQLSTLPPIILTRVMKNLGVYGARNKSLVVTRFLLHYLKEAARNPKIKHCKEEYAGLANTAVHGVVVNGRSAFSCRAMFRIMWVVSGLGLSNKCRSKLEGLIGQMLDEATLDDLLISGHHGGAVYDVDLVLRLASAFVATEEGEGVATMHKIIKVGRLLDRYLAEISPDQGLNISKFIELAECLPDNARESFDGLYTAIDIYLQSHPTLKPEMNTRIWECLNYEKLTVHACRDITQNPRIPPRIALQVLAGKRVKIETQAANEEGKLGIQKIRWRMVELRRQCIDMKDQVPNIMKNKHTHSRAFRKLRFC